MRNKDSCFTVSFDTFGGGGGVSYEMFKSEDVLKSE